MIEGQIPCDLVQKAFGMFDMAFVEGTPGTNIGLLCQVFGSLRIANDAHHGPEQGPAMQGKNRIENS